MISDVESSKDYGAETAPHSSAFAAYFASGEGAQLRQRLDALTGQRHVIAVAGAPGSGKSTLAAELVARLADAVLVPMDGFHLDDSILKERGLLSRKGAPETFDAEGFAVFAARLSERRSEVVFPVFDRSREIAVAGAGVVSPANRLVIVEGNYLLLARTPWNRISYDLTIWLDVPEPELRRRLTARWQGYGNDPQSVAAHLQNDLANARLVTTGSVSADISLVVEETHQEPG